MKPKLFISLFIICCFALMIVYDMVATPITSPQSHSDNTEQIQPQEMAPDVTLTSINGEEFTIKSLNGKVLLLNFWASWCTPCLQEFPAMVELTEDFPDQVVLIAISKDEKKEDINRFLNRFPNSQSPNIKVVWDADKSISESIFNTLRVPETIIIDQNGKMVRKIVGNSPLWHNGEIKSDMKMLITTP